MPVFKSTHEKSRQRWEHTTNLNEKLLISFSFCHTLGTELFHLQSLIDEARWNKILRIFWTGLEADLSLTINQLKTWKCAQLLLQWSQLLGPYWLRTLPTSDFFSFDDGTQHTLLVYFQWSSSSHHYSFFSSSKQYTIQKIIIQQVIKFISTFFTSKSQYESSFQSFPLGAIDQCIKICLHKKFRRCLLISTWKWRCRVSTETFKSNSMHGIAGSSAYER